MWKTLNKIDCISLPTPTLATGIDLGRIIDKLHDATFNQVLEGLIEQIGCTYMDSFLYPREQELYQLLGV
jgi:hypothetical protein